MIDTGGLVAALNRRDRWHGWAAAELDRIEPPLLTCEAVISEAAYVLGQAGRGGEGALLELLGADFFRFPMSFEQEQGAVAALMRKYADVPMSVADACLVRLAEVLPGVRVMTTDADFRIYRIRGRQVIPLMMPPGA